METIGRKGNWKPMVRDESLAVRCRRHWSRSGAVLGICLSLGQLGTPSSSWVPLFLTCSLLDPSRCPTPVWGSSYTSDIMPHYTNCGHWQAFISTSKNISKILTIRKIAWELKWTCVPAPSLNNYRGALSSQGPLVGCFLGHAWLRRAHWLTVYPPPLSGKGADCPVGSPLAFKSPYV